jgi:hypothetical protein
MYRSCRTFESWSSIGSGSAFADVIEVALQRHPVEQSDGQADENEMRLRSIR